MLIFFFLLLAYFHESLHKYSLVILIFCYLKRIISIESDRPPKKRLCVEMRNDCLIFR